MNSPDDQRRLLAADEEEDEVDDIVDDNDLHEASSHIDVQKLDIKIALAFIIMGAAMLWPFNAFITANEFFGRIFRENEYLLSIYSLAITSVFTVTNLFSTVYFTTTVRIADLGRRISFAAISTSVLFAALAVLTAGNLKAVTYFTFLILIDAAVGVTTGGLQNGCFGIVGTYGTRYVQFVFIGQGIAGVMPAILSIAVALIDKNPGESATRRAFAYFISSSLVLASSYFAHRYLQSRQQDDHVSFSSTTRNLKEPNVARYKKFLRSLHPWTIFLIFAITLSIFPSITASVLPIESSSSSKWLDRAVYIPLGFLLWNGGDLLGRVVSAFPIMTIESPKLLFTASIARILWIPIVYLCNVRGSGAVVKSDLFFLGFMLLFGLSNGFISSLTFASAIKQASNDEKKDVGAFMTFMLCSGLVVGSLLSFIF